LIIERERERDGVVDQELEKEMRERDGVVDHEVEKVILERKRFGCGS
jgi:hypothetical protein